VGQHNGKRQAREQAKEAQTNQVKNRYDERELTVREIAEAFNITPPTVYRALSDPRQ